MAGILLEIAANSIESALAAEAGGADRIELCNNLEQGGTTPSHGTIAIARERLRMPIHVLIRPRHGDFLYTGAEREVMLYDIEHCARLGCDAVVVGALNSEARVDTEFCRAMCAAAGKMSVTFHRAFDLCAVPEQSLEELIALGFARILSSGLADNAQTGHAQLASLVALADKRISIMAGAGIRPDNLAAVLAASGVKEIHASASGPHLGTMHHKRKLHGLAPDFLETQTRIVRALRQVLDQLDC
ncbi:copper homeostasis protein CutC [Undibacterium pigrum]|uniref:PF03932 family protein CutC n=1 Tax=Undibacterium pigrum TaxID=401470 RepID=A0A318JEU1_9BURK|nr:copper homeostasis protein CutC [Undibacterium pigrum]PXX47027.1 copper homeostasis protein CutC [Undibacterium pigrum]